MLLISAMLLLNTILNSLFLFLKKTPLYKIRAQNLYFLLWFWELLNEWTFCFNVFFFFSPIFPYNFPLNTRIYVKPQENYWLILKMFGMYFLLKKYYILAFSVHTHTHRERARKKKGTKKHLKYWKIRYVILYS